MRKFVLLALAAVIPVIPEAAWANRCIELVQGRRNDCTGSFLFQADPEGFFMEFKQGWGVS